VNMHSRVGKGVCSFLLGFSDRSFGGSLLDSSEKVGVSKVKCPVGLRLAEESNSLRVESCALSAPEPTSVRDSQLGDKLNTAGEATGLHTGLLLGNSGTELSSLSCSWDRKKESQAEKISKEFSWVGEVETAKSGDAPKGGTELSVVMKPGS